MSCAYLHVNKPITSFNSFKTSDFRLYSVKPREKKTVVDNII